MTNLRSTCVHSCLLAGVPASEGLLPTVNGHAERQVQHSVEEKENVIDGVQRGPRIVTRRVSARLSVPGMRVPRTLHTEGLYPYHTQRIQCVEPADMGSLVASCSCINANPQMIRNILFTNLAHFTRDGVNKTRNYVLWNHDNPHRTAKSKDRYRCFVNVFCFIISEQLNGPYICAQRLTSDIYANYAKQTATSLREGVLYQHVRCTTNMTEHLLVSVG
jgi:hypothetical protein